MKHARHFITDFLFQPSLVTPERFYLLLVISDLSEMLSTKPHRSQSLKVKI